MKGQTLESVFSHNEKSLAAMEQTAMHVGAYEPPSTVRTVVETEGNFCGSVIGDNAGSSDVETTNQKVQTDYYKDGKNPFDFSGKDESGNDYTWD